MAVAPPAALPRRPGLRDRVRAVRARRRGVAIGTGVALGAGVRFDVAPGGRVVVEDGAVLGEGCRLHVAAGDVRIGAGAVLGERCVVVCRERVVIGAGALLADEVVLIDADPRFGDVEVPVREQGFVSGPVEVGERARVGPGAVLQRGARVPAGGTLGAHELLSRPRAPRARASAGSPPASPSRP